MSHVLKRLSLPLVVVVLLLAILLLPVPQAFAAGNSVQVTVTNAKAIPVDTTGGAAPVNGFCQGFAAFPEPLVRCPLYTVPAGYRLIVESVGWQIAADPANTTSNLIFGLDDSAANGSINFLPNAQTLFIQHALTYSSFGVNIFAGSQLVNISFEAGQVFSAEYSYNTGPNYQQNFNFQGHLVSVP